MAIILFDGFDGYKTGGTQENPGLPSQATLDYLYDYNGTGFSGNFTIVDGSATLPQVANARYLQSSATSSSSNHMYYPVSNMTEICVGFHSFFSSSSTTNMVSLYNSNAPTNQIQFIISPGGIPAVYKQLAPVTTYTSETVASVASIWYHYEIRLQIVGQNVNVWAYRNGKLIAQLTNIPALSADPSFQNIDRVLFGKPPSGFSSTSLTAYDNLIITDGEVMGPVTISPMPFTSNDSPIEWLANSSLSNYACLNLPATNSIGGSFENNVTAANVGDQDFYQAQDLLVNDGAYEVVGVAFSSLTKGSEYGATEMQTKINASGIETAVDTISLSATAIPTYTSKNVLRTNPATSQGFTISEVNSSTYGIERTS